MITVASWLEGEFGVHHRSAHPRGLRTRHAPPGHRNRGATWPAEVDAIAAGTYARVVLVEEVGVAVQALVQSHGLGDMRPNLTVVRCARICGAATSDREKYGAMLQNCVRFGTNVAVVNVRDDAWERFESTPQRERTIALWWSDDQVGQLITLLGWLCTRHDDWADAFDHRLRPADGRTPTRSRGSKGYSRTRESRRRSSKSTRHRRRSPRAGRSDPRPGSAAGQAR